MLINLTKIIIIYLMIQIIIIIKQTSRKLTIKTITQKMY